MTDVVMIEMTVTIDEIVWTERTVRREDPATEETETTTMIDPRETDLAETETTTMIDQNETDLAELGMTIVIDLTGETAIGVESLIVRGKVAIRTRTAITTLKVMTMSATGIETTMTASTNEEE
jgi:hypothetical protein